MKKEEKGMKDRKGFTLVELLLVVAILAFLVAVIVIASSEIGKDSKKKAMYASLKSVKTAVETYYIQNANVFPATLDLLTTWVPDKPRLLDSIPKDNFQTGTPAVSYDLDTGGKATYVSWSWGPDGANNIAGAKPDDLDNPVGDDIFVTNAKDKVYAP